MGTRLGSMSSVLAGLLCASVLGVTPARRAQDAAASAIASAGSESTQAEPAPRAEEHYGRVVATATAGLAVRLAQNVDFDQDTLAPFYVDVTGGYVFGSSGA